MLDHCFTLHRGDTWPGFTLSVVAAEGEVVDFTGCTAESDIREKPDGPRLMSADVEVESEAGGATITVKLPADRTSLLQGSVVGDVELVLGDGRVFTPLRYELHVSRDATRLRPEGLPTVTYQGAMRRNGCTTSCAPIASTLITEPIPVTPGTTPTSGPVNYIDIICPDDSQVYRLTVRLNLNDQAVLTIEPAP